MATAVPYQSALIESLRAASPGFGSNNPGVTLLQNPANSKTFINFKRTPIKPYVPSTAPAPVAPPAPAPAPVSGGGGGGGGGGGTPPGGGGSITIRPVGSLPRIDVVPDNDFVGPMPNDFVGPLPDDFVGPLPNDFVGPPAPDDDGAQIFMVPDPAPLDAVDLPPLPPGGGGDDFVGPMPYFPSDDDFVGPPEPPDYDEIPQGEIEVGPPGNSQLARDAINRIGDITEVGDPLDELGDIELPAPVIDPPPVPPPEPEGGGDGTPTGGSGNFFVPTRDLASVSSDPLDEWEWIELEEPEIPLPDIPKPAASYSFSDAELLDMLLNDYSMLGR